MATITAVKASLDRHTEAFIASLADQTPDELAANKQRLETQLRAVRPNSLSANVLKGLLMQVEIAEKCARRQANAA